MIEIKVFKNKVTVKGHANYAKNGGDDIVCAAVSTLLQSMVLGIERLTEDEIKYQLKSGDSYVELIDHSNETLVLYDSFFISALAIAEEYPENVRVVLDETDKIY